MSLPNMEQRVIVTVYHFSITSSPALVDLVIFHQPCLVFVLYLFYVFRLFFPPRSSHPAASNLYHPQIKLNSETENQASKSVVHLVSSQFTLLLLKVLC